MLRLRPFIIIIFLVPNNHRGPTICLAFSFHASLTILSYFLLIIFSCFYISNMIISLMTFVKISYNNSSFLSVTSSKQMSLMITFFCFFSWNKWLIDELLIFHAKTCCCSIKQKNQVLIIKMLIKSIMLLTWSTYVTVIHCFMFCGFHVIL